MVRGGGGRGGGPLVPNAGRIKPPLQPVVLKQKIGEHVVYNLLFTSELYMFIHVCIYRHWICVYIYTCGCMCIYTHVDVCVCIYTCGCMYIYIHMWMYVYVS